MSRSDRAGAGSIRGSLDGQGVLAATAGVLFLVKNRFHLTVQGCRKNPGVDRKGLHVQLCAVRNAHPSRSIETEGLTYATVGETDTASQSARTTANIIGRISFALPPAHQTQWRFHAGGVQRAQARMPKQEIYFICQERVIINLHVVNPPGKLSGGATIDSYSTDHEESIIRHDGQACLARFGRCAVNVNELGSTAFINCNDLVPVSVIDAGRGDHFLPGKWRVAKPDFAGLRILHTGVYRQIIAVGRPSFLSGQKR